MKKIISYVLVFLIGVSVVPILNATYKKNLQERVIYKITIENEFINMRESIDLSGDPIGKVYKNEKYDVVEYYEGNSFNWYRIVYEDYKTAWIASGKDKSWVSVEYE